MKLFWWFYALSWLSFFLEKVLKENEGKFPIAYTIDIGILGCYQFCDNVVVEYNDMWAIGNYGMPNDLYLRLLRDRYFEIVSTK